MESINIKFAALGIPPPVDKADVIAGLVGADLGKLITAFDKRRELIAQQALVYLEVDIQGTDQPALRQLA